MFVITYYIDVPKESNTDIVFGYIPIKDWSNFSDSAFSTGRPKNGDILIFPAFYCHATSSQESSELRVNIGFDIQPV